MKNSINQKLPFTVFLFSILCAFFLDIKPVNWALVYGGFWKTETGVMNTLFPITIGIIVILGFIRNGVATFAKNTKGWFLILFLIIYFLFSTRFICPSHTTITLFMGFTIGGLIIPLLSRVDVCVLLKAIMIFPAFSILRTDLIFAEQLGSISMDASYGFIIPISACIVYYVNYFKLEKGFSRFLSIIIFSINAVFLGYLLLFGSRGPLFGLICLTVFLFVVKYQEGVGLQLKKSKWTVVLFIGLVLIVFIGPLMSAFSDLLSGYGINLYFVDKMISLQQEGDMLNGRENLNSLAFNGFLLSPIWGNGFDSFNAHTGLLYPHNFLLQILFDGGIILFCILVIPAIKETRNKYKNCGRDEFALATFLLFSSVPGALFSQNLWVIGPLWFFVGYLKSNNYIYKKKYERKTIGVDSYTDL